MIKSIEIEGLRGIKRAKIEGLAPLTMIVGPNGCGKSTVLEAVGLLCAGAHGPTAFGALASREWLGIAGMRFWFEDGARVRGTLEPAVDWTYGATTLLIWSSDVKLVVAEAELRIVVVGTGGIEKGTGQTAVVVDDDGSFSVRDSHQRQPLIPFALQAHFVDLPVGMRSRLNRRLSSAQRDALGAIKLNPWYDTWIEYLRELRPRIISIESLALDERDEPFVFEGPPREGYPLAYAGDGFRRSLLLAATLARAKGGVVAIDEPEAFAHPSMFTGHAKMVRRAIEDGTQVFMATHSLEFVTAALQAFEDDPEKVAVVGLRREGGVLDPVTISGPDASRRVLELGHDLRL